MDKLVEINEKVACNICGSDNYKIIFDENKAQIHRIIKCKNCGLMYANPKKNVGLMYEPQNLGVVVKNNELDSEIENISNEDEVLKELSKFTPENHQFLQKQYVHLKDNLKALNIVEKFTKEKGTLLDIGSYAGVFLNASKKRGWDVTGVEPSLIPAVYSKKTFNLNIIQDTFENDNFQTQSFDVIFAFHVIEHVFDPTGFITKAHNILKQNGILVLETPTYDSIFFKILRHRERSIKNNGHIYFFTIDTLKTLVEKCGYSVIKHEKVGRTLTLDRLCSVLGRISGKDVFFNSLSRVFNLKRFKIYLNAKDMQRIYCKKK